MKNTNVPRVAGAVIGDIARDPGARTKYGFFFEALGRRFSLLPVVDSELRGPGRWRHILAAFHPNLQLWRERYYQSPGAFTSRSRQAARSLRSLQARADVILQVGALFDAGYQSPLPTVLYTDYTAQLSAKKPEAGRSPFNARVRCQLVSMEQRVFQNSAFICTRSLQTKHSIVEDYHIEPERVHVVGGGVNFRRLPHRPQNRSAETSPTVLFIGKEFYRKGGDLLLEAFGAVHAEMPQARLIMVTGETGARGESIKGVEFVRPTWMREDIARLYRSADIFVLPSRLETWGDVLLEAMAFGLPCIGANSDAMAEIIDQDSSGILVPPGNVPALTSALKKLIKDSGLRKRLGDQGRNQVQTEFTWDRVVERMAPIIEAAATTSPRD